MTKFLSLLALIIPHFVNTASVSGGEELLYLRGGFVREVPLLRRGEREGERSPLLLLFLLFLFPPLPLLFVPLSVAAFDVLEPGLRSVAAFDVLEPRLRSVAVLDVSGRRFGDGMCLSCLEVPPPPPKKKRVCLRLESPTRLLCGLTLPASPSCGRGETLPATSPGGRPRCAACAWRG